MFLRIRHRPFRVTPPKIAIMLVRLGILTHGIDGKATAGLRCRDWRRRADEDEIAGNREEVVEGLGDHQLVKALVVLLLAQSALGVRGAQQGGHLIAVGIGGAEIATGYGADVGRFGDGLGHSPKLAPGQVRDEERLRLSGPNGGPCRVAY